MIKHSLATRGSLSLETMIKGTARGYFVSSMIGLLRRPANSFGGSFKLPMNQKQLFNQAISIYTEWKSTRIKSAHSRYQYYLNKLYESTGRIQCLNDLNEMHLVAFQRSLEQEDYADSTRAFAIVVVRNFLEFWHPKGCVSINPKQVKPQKFLTPEQPVVDEDDFMNMADLLSENKMVELQKKLALHLLWDTGMRVSELTDLKIGNLKQSQEGMRSAQIRTKKTDRYNLVIWSKHTEELLHKYLGWRILQNHPTDLLFIRTDRISKNGITTRTVERWVKKLAQDALIGKDITPHSFRHGKAHHILDNGGTAIDVQTILRHKNMNSSLHYMRLNEARYMKRASKFLGEDQPKENKTLELYPFASSNRMLYNAS